MEIDDSLVPNFFNEYVADSIKYLPRARYCINSILFKPVFCVKPRFWLSASTTWNLIWSRRSNIKWESAMFQIEVFWLSAPAVPCQLLYWNDCSRLQFLITFNPVSKKIDWLCQRVQYRSHSQNSRNLSGRAMCRGRDHSWCIPIFHGNPGAGCRKKDGDRATRSHSWWVECLFKALRTVFRS